MKITNYKEEKKKKIMEKCYECYCEKGFRDTGIKDLGRYCGMTSANLYAYFDNIDDLVVQSTAYCMAKVEDDFMALAPKSPSDLTRFIDEIPYWTAKKHGKKYRLMYQVYTHPKYRKYGQKFFDGVNQRYTEYSERLAEKLGISADMLRPMIFVFVRACVHYALYEDEFYLHEQLKFLKMSINLFFEKYNPMN